MRNELIYWRDVPMDVDIGAFEYISKNWGNKVIVVCMNDFEDERKKCNWKESELINVETIILEDKSNKYDYARDIINKYPDAIHVFGGIRGKKQKYLKYYFKRLKKYKVGIIAERPSIYGNRIILPLKKVVLYIIYSLYHLKWGKKIKFFMAMGTIGVKTYNSYGWNKQILYPFMYNPKLEKVKNNEELSEVIRLLYIGRFDYNSKGLDVLMKAIDSLNEEKRWILDIVGGYGAKSDEVITWAKNKKNVNFIGTWDADEISKKMINYDVCIVPSKYDGWNMTPNNAINAGIGTIITDQSGSDELICESGAGIVVTAKDFKQLEQAINYVLDNPSIINEWKKKAEDYSYKISSDVVGQYFIDIIDYTFKYRDIDRPKCPWIKE